jgi:hypothetical protein
MSRSEKRDSGHHGRVAESRLAIRVGGKLQPGSGAVAGAKGDVKLDHHSRPFLLESKTTKGESITIRRDWCFKIYQEALEVSRHPGLAVTFTDPLGKSEKRERWVMVPEAVFLDLIAENGS